MKKMFRLFIAFSCAMICLSSCGKDDDDKEPAKPNADLVDYSFSVSNLSAKAGSVITVYLDSTSNKLKVKEQFTTEQRLYLMANPRGAELKNVKLETDDDEVAVVNNDGTITCVAPGITIVKATVDTFKTVATCKLIVSKNALKQEFLFYVEDVFSVSGDPVKTVATGTVSYGQINKGDKVSIYSSDGSHKEVVINGLEMFRKEMDEIHAGDNAGISFLASALSKESIKKGDAITIPNTSYSVSNNIVADIYFLTSSEGGRKTDIPASYRPQFFHDVVDVTCMLDNDDVIKLGSTVYNMNVELINYRLLQEGDEFDLREGGRVVAKGIVRKIK